MKTKYAVVLMICVLFSAQSWAQFVAPGGAIPVIADNSGLNGTYWRSDVTIMNTDDMDTSVTLVYFPELVNGVAPFEPIYLIDEVTVPGSGQVTLKNIVRSRFGLFDQKGALSVFNNTGAPLVLSSRVYTYGDNQCEGTYGQDVNSVLVQDKAWAVGLEHSASFRTNLGIFLPFAPPTSSGTTFTVEVFDEDGSPAGSGSIVFKDAGMRQVNLDTFEVGLLLDGYAVITSSDSSTPWYAYASVVDETSGDAVFRVARGRQLVK